MRSILKFSISYPPFLFIPSVFLGEMKTTARLSGRQYVGVPSTPGTNPPKVSVPGAGGVPVKKATHAVEACVALNLLSTVVNIASS